MAQWMGFSRPEWRNGWDSRGPNGAMDGILEALMAQWMGFSRP